MIKFTSKEAFVAALEARRPFWQAYDSRQEDAHKTSEHAWHERAKAKLRKAMACEGYDEFIQFLGGGKWTTSLDFGTRPECPVLMEAKIDKELRVLAMTQGKSFNVGPTGSWGTAYTLLSHDPDAKTSVC